MHVAPNRMAAIALLVALCLGSGACGTLSKIGSAATAPIKKRKLKKAEDAQREESPPNHPIPIGEISYVNTSARFVLVRTGRKLRLNPASDLQARRGMMLSANLAFSPEQKQGYLTADIINGMPAIGDIVYTTPDAQPDVEERRQQAEERQQLSRRAAKKAQHNKARKRMTRKSR